MIHDQANELRQLVRERALYGAGDGPAVPLVIISGGKGGVGATTIAVNLAVALARQGRRTVFVDADLDHGGTTHLGESPPRGSVADVLAGRRTVHEALQRGPSGIQVLSGAWASTDATDSTGMAQQRFVKDLKQLALHADVVVVDAGSSRNSFARRLWQAASLVLVVTTADSIAVMESYAAIKVLLASEETTCLRSLVNLAPEAKIARGAQSRIAEACRRFLGLRADAAGHVPRCEAGPVGEAALVFPASSASARAIDAAADTIWTQLQLGLERAHGGHPVTARSA